MATKIRIAARLRPFIPGEQQDGTVEVVHEDGSSFITVLNAKDNSQIYKYPFSSCYGHFATQEEIYNRDVSPNIDHVYNGVVVTVFAYGVTSSGKTHTMQGTRADPGIIPRVVKDVFERKRLITQYEVIISVSYMEIYRDDVYDLMVERDTAPKLPVRERGDGQVFVANLSLHPINGVTDFERIYNAASKRRSTGATNLNRASSRSHAILTLNVEIIDRKLNQIMTGKINLVDLAGSENNKLTGNDSARMAESASINKSLSVLGQVVHALNQGAPRIPYRDSKLTRILQDALGGKSVGVLICNLAPGSRFRQDTLNTLNFATRTKEIENRPVVNVQDAQPLKKAHFAALPVPPPQLPPANVPNVSGPSGRPSLGPTAGPSRLPAPKHGRLSATGFRPFALDDRRTSGGSITDSDSSAPPQSGGPSGSGFGMTPEELNERIAKAVELEVERRLAEREKELEALATAKRAEASTADDSTRTLVSEPLALAEHHDQDRELIRRVQELEDKYEQNSKDDQFAAIMSPVSKKKLGRAYVALARSHSDKGNLQLARNFFKKAEEYVPDNIKLKERIIEIDWAIKHNTKFVSEPKKKKKGKDKVRDNAKRSGRSSGKDKEQPGDNWGEPFNEATNSPHKRTANHLGPPNPATPAKKQRRDGEKELDLYSGD